MSNKIGVKIEWNYTYGTERYSKPWIAKVTSWQVGEYPDMEWGIYFGDGDGGDLEIRAVVGDVVRWGQADNYNEKGTEKHWGVVQADGSVEECSELEAKKAYRLQELNKLRDATKENLAQAVKNHPSKPRLI